MAGDGRDRAIYWPYYVAATAVLVVSLAGAVCFSTSIAKLVCTAAMAGSAYFLCGSLGVSHLIYDRSDLYRWRWLDRALGGAPLHHAIFCHSGFDESSAELRTRFPHTEWLILDHFEETRMTEASIRRARKLFPPAIGTLASSFDRWPVAGGTANAVFGLLAIHELRSTGERSAWFSEARRSLVRGGRVILVEHLRDLPNFLVFGSGFLHFHSRESWRRTWENAGFQVVDEFRVTPWLGVFVLTVS